MPQGITRNRYNDLLKSKGKSKQSKKRFSKASLNKTFDDQQYIRSSLLSNSTKSSQVQMNQIQQPSWIQDYKDCCFILKQVEICRQQMKKQQKKKIMTIKPQIHQKKISLLAEQATQKLRKCQKKLKNIQLSNNMNQCTHQKKMFTNIIVSLAQKIRTLTKQLRLDRQNQLSNDQQIRRYSNSQFDQQMKFLSQTTTQDDWFTQQKLEEIQSKLSQQRNQQIIKIVQSIHSLNSIYKELQDLVIYQGSLLDRIDQNIQITYTKVQQANQHLVQAQEYQKSPFANKIIKVLIALIFIFFLIFIIKHR